MHVILLQGIASIYNENALLSYNTGLIAMSLGTRAGFRDLI